MRDNGKRTIFREILAGGLLEAQIILLEAPKKHEQRYKTIFVPQEAR